MNYRFGVIGGLYGPRTAQRLHELGGGWMGYPVNRGEVQRPWGRWNWAPVDGPLALKEAYLGDMRVLLRVRNHPYGPADARGYGRFIERLLRRVGHRIDAYQVCNEPDSPKFWDGTPEQYIGMLRAGARAARRVASHLPVLAAGLTNELTAHLVEGAGTDAVQWYISRAAQLADIADVHCYYVPDTITRYTEWMADRSGLPVWITEMGGPDSAVTPPSEADQVADMEERIRRVGESAAEVALWLGLHPSGDNDRWRSMSLLGPNAERKPRFDAYAAAIGEMT